MDPAYDEEEIAKFYPQNYYAFTDRFPAGSASQSRWKKLAKKVAGLREYETKDPKFTRPGRLLDVGCGSGWFLSKMRKRGWEVRGVEPSRAAAELGRSEQGLDIFAGSLLDAAFAPESFDYIRFNHSFEHVGAPGKVLAEVHRILARNGKLMIGVPNRSSLNALIFREAWVHLALPLHPFSYSTKTLSRMLEKHAFKVEKVTFNTYWNGLLMCLQMFANRNDRMLSAEGRISKSRLARILCTWGADLQNLLHIADAIEITAVKQ